MTESNESMNIASEPTPYLEVSDPSVMAKNPVVSVLMITYNHDRYIAQAIEGVLQQKTSFPIELIIGEDCSTDGTREIVFNYQQKYPDIIHVLASINNVGFRMNGERVRMACRGKYIAFCEGDDYWHNPNKIQKQIEHMELYPEVGLIHSDVDRYYIGKKFREPSYHKGRRLLYKYDNVLYGMIANEYIVDTCTAVVRSNMLNNIINECKFEFSDEFMMGDVQMWIEIAFRSKVKYIDESFAIHNMLEESASNTKCIDKSIKFLKNHKEILLHYANKYGGGKTENLKKNIVSYFNSILSTFAYKTRNYELGREILEDFKKNGVPLGPTNYIFLVSTKNNVSSKMIRCSIPFILLFLSLLKKSKMFWLIRDRIIHRST